MASAAFLARWRSVTTRDAAVLVSIEFSQPSYAIIFAASAETATPRGATQPARVWEDLLLDVEPIRAEGDLLSNDPSPVAASFTLKIRKLGFQAASKTVLDALKDYRWDATATVTIYLWERSLASWDDAQQQFRGVIELVESDAASVRVLARQSMSWNREVTPTFVTRGKYPYAAQPAVGQPIPVVRGSIRPPPMRPPWPARYDAYQRTREWMTGGSRTHQAILVDSGRGGSSKARVLVCSNRASQFGPGSPPVYGTSPWLLGSDGRLHALDPAFAEVFLSAADGAGFNLPDGQKLAIYPLVPVEVEIVANNAADPKLALDANNEVTYARLDYANLLRELRVRLPAASNPGEPDLVKLYLLYRSSASLTGAPIMALLNTATGIQSNSNTIPASTTPSAWDTPNLWAGWGSDALPSAPWNFGECVIRVYWPAAGTGTIDVFAVGMIVRYKPERDVVQSEKVVGYHKELKRGRLRFPFGIGGRHVYHTYLVPDTIPAVTELRANFFANLDGQIDDGFGTFSNAANGLIERAPDMISELLVTYGGQTVAEIERGTGVFGSFIDARALMKTWRASDMVLALSVSEKTDLAAVVSGLANAAAAWVYRSRFDDKWHFRPWNDALAVTYPWKFDLAHISDRDGPRCRRQPNSDVAGGVQLTYGYDAATRTYLHESTVAPARSVSGYLFRNLRDQFTDVVAGENDRLDFKSALGTFTASLTAGMYTPSALVQHLAAQMATAEPSGVYVANYIPTVVAGFNDRLNFNDGADKTAIIPPATYASMESLAAAVQAAFNAASSGFAVSYSRATKKITISRSSGTLQCATGLLVRQTGYPLLGFSIFNNRALAGAVVGDIAVEEQLVVLACKWAGWDLLWRTGANGSENAKRMCAEQCGFDPAEDSAGMVAGINLFTGFCPVGDGAAAPLESLFVAAGTSHGRKRTITVDAKNIYDDDTAREVRNRIARLLGKARTVVTFSTEYAPDMMRGAVVEFEASLDAVQPYPDPAGDGSWVGKKFVVTEVEQNLGPASFATRVVAVSL